jgi:multiple sugar transport system substrate-binding protein
MEKKKMRKITFMFSALMVISMLLAACGPAATATTAPTDNQPTPADTEPEAPTETPAAAEPTGVPQPTAATGFTGTKIVWFIGLGAGGNPEEVAKETAFVNKFNAKYGDKYYLVMQVVANATAVDVLKTQIASGDVPDIVGPVGVKGMFQFEGAWLDLTDQIAKNNTDLSDFDPALIDFYKMGPQGQIGLPFAIYPNALWYNKDLFDEAGLAYPPHKFGEPYIAKDGTSSPWTFDEMQKLAMVLTVDKQGNDANSPDFDNANIAQWGYDSSWMDIRGQWNSMGASTFVAPDGKTAVLSPEYRAAAHWYYDGMWKHHFIPTGSESASDYLAQTNTFASGKIAMDPMHTWYTCCFQDVNWDIAAIPSHNGKITANLNADTFGVLKAGKNQDVAYEVLALMLGEFAPDLAAVYGAFPARKSLQADAIAAMQTKYPDVDLQVFIDAIQYADNPNYESGLPNFLKSYDIYSKFGSLYNSKGDLDLDAELDKLIQDLQASFDSAE